MKKGQTAMEYLMTYGWAILIILIVGAVLAYYGVFNVGSLVPKGGCTSGNLYIAPADWFYAGDGTLTLKLENRVGETITLSTVKGTVGTTSNSTATSESISSGTKSTTITVSNLPTGPLGEVKTLDLEVNYTIPTGVAGTRTYTCTVSGKVGE